jgi:thymidylate synthase
MKQYLDLLTAIITDGTDKPGARAGMPGSRSLFGYQFRHDLSTGFPALTTKKLAWKTMVVELLWFLRGDTNIKYLVDNGCNIWNEDAYNYYKKVHEGSTMLTFEDFVDRIKSIPAITFEDEKDTDIYQIGDCGHQYGKVWRDFGALSPEMESVMVPGMEYSGVDQIARVISSLKNSPESRRHIITAIDPVHDTDLALYWCHAMFQFNCRPLTHDQRLDQIDKLEFMRIATQDGDQEENLKKFLQDSNIPKYYLDCQLYQRSADVVLGVPFNIASYALLTHIIAKICNMVPGHFIHTFGDVHIYDNHTEAVDEQLSRTPTKLPTLHLNDRIDWKSLGNTLQFEKLVPSDFTLENYNPQAPIKAKLSTGLQ